MCVVYCRECSTRRKTYVTHQWPPCDYREDGSAIEPLECGHRRACRDDDGTCHECKVIARREGERRVNRA